MSGYIDLNRTGFAEFDDVLTAIEDAGDAYHHTSQWQENDCGEPSHIERINAKINEAREALHSDGLIQVSRAEYEALQKAAGQYYQVMDLLRDSMYMKHGVCEPRERRACTRCNATDDLATMVSEYRGEPIRAAIKQEGGE